MAQNNPKKEARQDKRIEKKYEKVNAKMAKAKAKSPEANAKAEKKYGYKYESAIKSGIQPDSTGHWPSRNPETGQILKGPKHPTFSRTKAGEKAAGYKMFKAGGDYYSMPKENKAAIDSIKKMHKKK